MFGYTEPLSDGKVKLSPRVISKSKLSENTVISSQIKGYDKIKINQEL